MICYFVQTSDEERIVRIPSNEADGPLEIVPAVHGPTDFNLTNVLKTSTMKEARLEAKRNGLRLRRPGVMGTIGY